VKSKMTRADNPGSSAVDGVSIRANEDGVGATDDTFVAKVKSVGFSAEADKYRDKRFEEFLG
jgi:hypothetical protein